MPNENDIRRSAEMTSKELARLDRLHLRRLEKSLQELQDSIKDSLLKLQTSDGKLDGLKVNLKQAQAIHRSIEEQFGSKFSNTVKQNLKDFRVISNLVNKSYSQFGDSTKFTGADKGVMNTLKSGYYRNFLNIGEQQKEKIVQGVYNQVIGNARFSTLVATVEQALMGSDVDGIPGSSLLKYSKLYARDITMNFHQEVNLMKADKAGLTHFLYIGDIIETTRPFCAFRAGKYYTKEEIAEWDEIPWAGKSGPALTHRGGWNCRHHWQAIDPAWMEGKEKLDIADWDLEGHGEKTPSVVKPPKPPKEPKQPKVKPPKVAKEIIPVYESEKIDGVTVNYDPETREEYLGYKKEYDDFFGRHETWKEPSRDANFREDIIQEYEQKMPNAWLSMNHWQSNTHREEAMFLKQRAALVEGEANIGKMIIPDKYKYEAPQGETAAQHFNALWKDDNNGSSLPKEEYLRLRAFNQAYMENRGIDNIKLYRGTNGPEGLEMVEDIKRTMRNDPDSIYAMRDASLTGYTESRVQADKWGVNRGCPTIEKIVPRERILIHKDLLSGSTMRYDEEQEYVIFGGEFFTTNKYIYYPGKE